MMLTVSLIYALKSWSLGLWTVEESEVDWKNE